MADTTIVLAWHEVRFLFYRQIWICTQHGRLTRNSNWAAALFRWIHCIRSFTNAPQPRPVRRRGPVCWSSGWMLSHTLFSISSSCSANTTSKPLTANIFCWLLIFFVCVYGCRIDAAIVRIMMARGKLEFHLLLEELKVRFPAIATRTFKLRIEHLISLEFIQRINGGQVPMLRYLAWQLVAVLCSTLIVCVCISVVLWCLFYCLFIIA